MAKDPKPEPPKTDAEVHAAHAGGRTEAEVHAQGRMGKIVNVKEGEKILHYVRLGCWFKDTGDALNPDRNTRAIAKQPFTYYEGQGVRYHTVRFKVLERWFAPFKDAAGNYVEGGAVPLLDPEQPLDARGNERPNPYLAPLMNPALPTGEIKAAAAVLATA